MTRDKTSDEAPDTRLTKSGLKILVRTVLLKLYKQLELPRELKNIATEAASSNSIWRM